MKTFFKSVKLRLTLWYAFILTVFLSLFAYQMYSELARTLYRDTDQALRQQAITIERSLYDFLNEEGLERFPADGREMTPLIESWEAREQHLNRATHMIRVLQYDHALLISNLKGWEKEIIFPNFERDSVFMEKGTSFQTIHFLRKPVRLYYHWMYFGGRPAFVIQTGTPLHGVDRTLSRLVFIILVWIPAAVGAAGIAGWFLAHRSLRPIDSMIREARQITVAYLKGRLPRTGAGDELDRLASTLNEMLDRLSASTQAVQEFSSNVSHELKTPLAIIRGEIDLALRKSRSKEDLRETLRVIEEEINGLIRLVDDLMLLVRSDSRQLRLEKSLLMLGDLLKYAVGRFKERAERRNVTLTCLIEKDVELEGDEVYLKRLFSNLIDNAIKFTGEGGRVLVHLNQVGPSAVVRISDSGIGIEAEIQARVFSRFYRADQARSHEGAGLGLNIAAAICKAHQGALTLKSEPGRGTDVFVELPLSSSPQ